MKHLIPKRMKRDDRVPTPMTDERPFTLLHQRMDDLFNELFETFGGARWPEWPGLGTVRGQLSPHFEVAETDAAIEVKAELPGMDEKDIEIILDNNILTIRGEKKEEREEKEKDYHLSEVHYGHFSRVVPVPTGINLDQVKSTFKKGVLRLTLPKTEEAKSHRRRIAITTE